MSEFNQAKYIQQFQKEKYDRMIFNVPKGQKAVIEQHWRSKGYKSLNAYVNALIEKDMQESNERATISVKSGKNLNRLRLIARARAREKKYQISEK